MKSLIRVLSVTTVTFLVLAYAPQSAARFKCWTNSDGIRECGNSVPPEYSQTNTQTITGQGVVVESSARAKTPEEIEAGRAEAEKVAQAEEEKKKQAKLDRVLLDTYSNIDDMEMARDGKIVALESRIKLTESHLIKLQENLDKQIAQAAETERSGKQPSEEVIANIETTRKQIGDNQAFIDEKTIEIEAIREKYTTDIERFVELRRVRY